ncbi:gliding motility-associated C-terminal domain-containing protein [Carboxylicivirga sp. RSCT41]|uniref:T9SS type B sorting domain-containing protein n=1 Tax=Carboxylicivirga agarovorans TaxID=3417570 RepID=UPI003D332E2F
MRKYLLIVFVLLIWTGVDELYAQKPTITVSVEKAEICGVQQVTVTLVFFGSGEYDYSYEVDPEGDGNPEKFIDIPFTGDPYVDATDSKIVTFSGSGYFKVTSMYDVNLSEFAEIIYKVNGVVIEEEQIDIAYYTKPIPVLSPDVTTCRTEITLSADPGGDYTEVIWDYTATGTGSFLSKDEMAATFKADAAGNFDIIYKVINGACKDQFDTKNFDITEVPEPSATFTISDDRICSDEQVFINVEGNAANRYDIKVVYEDDQGMRETHTQASASGQIELFPDGNTTYTIISLSDSEECMADINETFALQVDSKPMPSAGVVGSPVCGTETTLDGQISNTMTNSGSWSVIDLNGSGIYFDDVNDDKSAIYVNDNDQQFYESYTLKLTEFVIDNPTCMGEAQVQVEFYKVPESSILTDVDVVYHAKEIELKAEPIVNGMTGKWEALEFPSSSPTIVSPEAPITSVNGIETGKYSFRWTVSNGEYCSDFEEADELVFENKGMYETNGFSPNGDTVNDYFIIGGADNVINNKLTIFDVTGKVIYKAVDFMQTEETALGWDGIKDDGKKEDGTYYYIFEGDNIDPIKSYLIIKGSK